MTKRKRPNIIVIMSDQHNAGIIGCYGNEIVITPNLDKLAENGVTFNNAYCPSPLCVPSRMSFMTGRYPSDIEVWHNTSRLSSDIPTFAHALGCGGYEAILSGRMHFSGIDQFHGFEKRLHGDCWRYLGPGMIFVNGNKANRTTGQTRSSVEVSGYGETGYQEFDKVITNHSCEFIKNHSPEERPYCMVVGYMLPHNPYIAEKELFEYYLDKLPVPEVYDEDTHNNLHPFIKKWRELRGVDKLAPEQHHRALAAYYALTEEMDRNIGRIIESVENSDEADNTIIVYTSDHGDMASEHNGMWWKSCFYEGSARIPLIVSDPMQGAKNKQVNSCVNLIDLTATILDYADCEHLPDITGKSLSGFIKETDMQNWDNETFSEFSGAFGEKPSCMFRRDNFKLIYYSETNSIQLFNLENDREELKDLSENSEFKSVADGMLNVIHNNWSAERMIKESEKEKQYRAIIDNCGHTPLPHDIHDECVSVALNNFDYSQIPFAESVLNRKER